MKRLYFLFGIVLFSCTEQIKILPNSTGTYSEIIFVVDNLLWNEVNELIKETFQTPLEGVNQTELEFTIVQINSHEFTNIFKRHKNIVIINNKSKNISRKNKWSQGQLLIELNLDDDKTSFLEKLQKIKQIFKTREIHAIQQKIIKDSKKNAETLIKESFNIDVIIPSEYTIVNSFDNFFWATYNPTNIEEIHHIMVFSINKQIHNESEVLYKVDSLFSKNLFGNPEGSYVKIEPNYQAYFNGNICRSLWKLENGFMGGPIIIKRYFLERKTIISLGLIFAPGKNKRNHIKTLEAIL